MKKIIVTCFLLLCTFLPPIAGHASANDVRIGVLAVRGPEDAQKYWSQVSDYLNAHLPGLHCVIVPHTYASMDQAVATGQLEFVVANPSQYVEFEEKYEASRIATLVNRVGKSESSFIGSVIFTRADRTDIVSLEDLKGKSLTTASKTAFASWLVTRDVLKRHGISSDDLGSVTFGAASADTVVMAVKKGDADVGAVRTNVLEQMALEGKIAPTDFRILNQQHVAGFPFLLSSKLYPEFAFARLKQTDRALANRVAAFLLLMPHDGQSGRYSTLIGWTVPENYRKVRTLLQEWRRPPYQDYGKKTLKEAIRQNLVSIVMAFTVLVAVLLVVVLSLSIRKRRKKFMILNEAKQKLDLLHTMIVATPDAIFIKDKQGHYVFVNPEAAYIIGRPAEDIIGKSAADFFPAEEAQAMIDDDNAVMITASSISYEEQSLHPDPSKYMLVTKGPMYDDQGAVDGVFIVARDITGLKQLQNEKTEKVKELETALANVRQLEGIIPICSYCKCIRDDKESWHQMESYISKHSDAEFSHGICPKCYEQQLLEIKSMKF